ncbi:MAG: FumA C-terminus/TtdB family hydratase beta subunit [Patescibacteria group bacterium]
MLVQNIFELIRTAATNLPADVAEALLAAKKRETNSRGQIALAVILRNIFLAQNLERPLCQDTGALTFFVKSSPKNWPKIEKAILTATEKATKIGLLRPNSVDPLSGKNLGNIPKIEFENQISPNPSLPKRGAIEIQLLLKGGGSENVSAQISLPAETRFGLAGRDLAGIEKAACEIIQNSIAKGCPPGVASIVVGGDRAEAFKLAKKNLLQKIGKQNSDPVLAKVEATILRKINSSKIGAGGLGGRTTLLDCRVAALPRHPASFFVTLAYSCWATRRAKIVLDSAGKILQKDSLKKFLSMELDLGEIKKIQLPISEKEIRQLRAGDLVAVSGRIFTARDQVHQLALKKKLPQDLRGLGIFHAGPIAIQNKVAPRQARDKFPEKEIWKIVAAGPTTSARLDLFTPQFLAKTGARVLIGKGGMGEATRAALQKSGAVYLHAIGGAAAFYADSIKKVHSVNFLAEFGMPEAMWELEIENFLAIVGMDSVGGKI